MSKRINLQGKRFGYWRVIKFSQNNEKGRAYWLCQCDCGNEKEVLSSSLLNGNSQSCGCKRREVCAKTHYKHGYASKTGVHPLYRIGKHILDRCENPNTINYADYGGRGITVCEEWHDITSFISWGLANGYKEGLVIDRIDNNQGYSPDNCRWVTQTINNNNRRNTVFVEINGEKIPASVFAKERGVSIGKIYKLIHKGYKDKELLERL